VIYNLHRAEKKHLSETFYCQLYPKCNRGRKGHVTSKLRKNMLQPENAFHIEFIIVTFIFMA